ncbi:MAG: ketoacyl-ACP synthase III [Mediterranea sp.]|jgi:3-oxoacyl-[acyl-carrier-protein] synthase-3|nr:ketoacyl-ACP synthase III [Mediterranea sp.]
MFINAIGQYVPKHMIQNSYFTDLNGLTDEWIYQRTGIKSRVRASSKETIEYMCRKAVERALPKLPYDISEVGLIIFASYTPSDTVGTVGHLIQREFNIASAKVFYISSACSSGINAMEAIKSYFDSGLASKALLICADRNSSYSDDTDSVAGHLWGDAAVAYFFSKASYSQQETKILAINTQGLGHIGLGPEAVKLNLPKGGLQMPFGKDVFTYACTYIAENTEKILKDNGYEIEDLSYFIGHQANMRILKNVAQRLGLPEKKSLSNIERMGNTGSASALLVFAMNYDRYEDSDLICMSVFGGGYSAGACLMKTGHRSGAAQEAVKEAI